MSYDNRKACYEKQLKRFMAGGVPVDKDLLAEFGNQQEQKGLKKASKKGV